jgi:hypothetical protein
MCLILDANIVHKVFRSPSADYRPVQKALAGRRATLVYGGGLRREYVKMGWFRSILRRLDQAGAARILPDNEVDACTRSVVRAGGYRSDDPHILALALVAGVRLLCSEDNDLSADFTNGAIIRRPRGNVYCRAGHARLLQKHCRTRRPSA